MYADAYVRICIRDGQLTGFFADINRDIFFDINRYRASFIVSNNHKEQ